MWFVTTLGPIDDKWGFERTRCVGYFETFEDAETRVINNVFDLYEEGYYPYAVIEDIKPGLYMSMDSTPIYYKFSRELGKYEKISVDDLPEVVCHFRGFAIG